MIDISVNNAWLLYRRDSKACNIGKNDVLPLKGFDGLLPKNWFFKGKNYTKESPKATTIGKNQVNFTDEELRYDGIQHYPDIEEKGRCKLCKTGQTTIKCIKCSIRLCLTKDRNCFYKFHHK